MAVLFTSGYTENAIVHGGRLDAGVELLGKPYTRDNLARKVRHVLSNQQQKNALLAASLPPAASVATTSKARVLLVEDDDAIRENTAELMRFLGYEVLEAADAEAAMDLLHRAPDIVLTDLHLPKMQGDELALKVKARLPQTRIAFASGASQASSVADAILAKPYDAQQLEALLVRLA